MDIHFNQQSSAISFLEKNQRQSKHMQNTGKFLYIYNQLEINNQDYSPTAGSFPKPKMYSTQN